MKKVLLTSILPRFTGVSAIGLAADLVIFEVLAYAGLDVYSANTLSSCATVTILYFLVTRFAFEAKPTLRTYLLFVTWYLVAIPVYSTLASLASEFWGDNPLWGKLCVIPVSFTCNFLVNLFVFRGGYEALTAKIEQIWRGFNVKK